MIILLHKQKQASSVYFVIYCVRKASQIDNTLFFFTNSKNQKKYFCRIFSTEFCGRDLPTNTAMQPINNGNLLEIIDLAHSLRQEHLFIVNEQNTFNNLTETLNRNSSNVAQVGCVFV